jgi:hypothetical protein
MHEQLTQGLSQFQSDLLRIIAEFMGKKDPKKLEDREIVSKGLSIWMSCIASDPLLLNQLQDDFAKLESEPENPSLQFARILVEKGVTSTDYKFKEAFSGTIRFIVEFIKSPQLKEPSLVFFIRILLSKMEYIQHKADSKHTKFYFNLLREMLPIYFAQLQSLQGLGLQQVFDPAVLLREMIERLDVYQPTEKRTSSLDDYTLIGFIEVIQILIDKRPDSVSADEYV